MTLHDSPAVDAEADIRWRDWQARGADGDRRRAATMWKLSVIVTLALALWLMTQFI
jgi:hypothetical protein